MNTCRYLNLFHIQTHTHSHGERPTCVWGSSTRTLTHSHTHTEKRTGELENGIWNWGIISLRLDILFRIILLFLAYFISAASFLFVFLFLVINDGGKKFVLYLRNRLIAQQYLKYNFWMRLAGWPPTSVVNFVPRFAELINNALKSPSQAGAPCPPSHHMLCVVWLLFLLQNICNLHAPKKKKMCVWCVTNNTNNNNINLRILSKTRTHTHSYTHWGTLKTVKRNARVQNVLSVGCLSCCFFFWNFFFAQLCASRHSVAFPHWSCPRPPPRSKGAQKKKTQRERKNRSLGKNSNEKKWQTEI